MAPKSKATKSKAPKSKATKSKAPKSKAPKSKAPKSKAQGKKTYKCSFCNELGHNKASCPFTVFSNTMVDEEKPKRIYKCQVCFCSGHNSRTCPVVSLLSNMCTVEVPVAVDVEKRGTYKAREPQKTKNVVHSSEVVPTPQGLIFT